jgi:drug/metabolite transporter (DMT)-like permease
VTVPPSPPPSTPLQRIGPAILAATGFACGDVLGRVVLTSGVDVLTMSTFRSMVGVCLLYAWLRVGVRAVPLSRRAMWISFGLGALFTGNVYFLFKAIEAVQVPLAVLTYFVYPLLTGVGAALLGLEALSWRGAVAALAAFLGLALMIGAHPGDLALLGIGAALAAAVFRVATLLIQRAVLAGADPRLITWYALLSSTSLFLLASLLTWTWNMPATAGGWVAFLALGPATTVGVLFVFISAARIGPFRTALFMNLEPLLATLGSALFLGEVISPLQALGGAVMIAALIAFQLRK